MPFKGLIRVHLSALLPTVIIIVAIIMLIIAMMMLLMLSLLLLPLLPMSSFSEGIGVFGSYLCCVYQKPTTIGNCLLGRICHA